MNTTRLVRLLISLFLFLMISPSLAQADVLPVELTITVNGPTTAQTQVQVSTGWIGTSWMSQPGIGPSVYQVGVKADGTVVSIDGQLSFTPWPDSFDSALRMYIRHPSPSRPNGADALLYTKSGNSVIYGNHGFVDFNTGLLSGPITDGNGFSMVHSEGNWQNWRPLPQYFRIHAENITPGTRIQISNYYAGVKWVSQPILARGDFIVRIDPDGFVRSIDSKLGFSKQPEASDSALTFYIMKPDARNGADYYRYTWSKGTTPVGAVNFESSGFVDFSNGVTSGSTTGNTVSLTTTSEVLYPESFMVWVHLDSVTRYTYLHIPFYWKHVIYRSTSLPIIGLGAGDYFIQVMPDPAPSDPNSAPFVLSLDKRIYFHRIYCPEAPDPVLAFFIALPNRPQQGFDVVGFRHALRRANSYQTMMGENKTGPDLGLGFVETNVLNPRDAITNYPTTPTETLTGGNFIVVTDAGMAIGRVVNYVGRPLAGAVVSIDGVPQVADGNGEFRFTHMVGGDYTLVYQAGGYQTQTQRITINESGPTYLPQVTLSP